RAIDRWGARPVLIATNLLFAVGLCTLANATGSAGLFVAWLILGVGMGSGLYDAAFASLVRLYGTDSRNAIRGITLIAGFASTVGWPLSTYLEIHVGWRGACYTWALLHLILGLPLNFSFPKAAALVSQEARETVVDSPADGPRDSSHARRAAILLAIVFAATWFISTAMAAHLPRLLQASGTSLGTAVALGALIGPAQVAGRLLEMSLLRRSHPLLSARIAAILHPAGAVGLLLLGGPAAAVFALLHGAGNGILMIANGTLPLLLFGPHGYGRRQGLLMIPARIAQASSPWLFGLALDRWGSHVLWLSTGISLMAFAALIAMPKSPTLATSIQAA
ncbi:MAG: MFS transporter, partial [Burkholderiaceae bacterium]